MEPKIMLTIRIDPAAKTRLSRAAEWSGKTLSQFLIDAAEGEAASILAAGPPSMARPANGVPDLFRMLCAAAHSGGSGLGYSEAGGILFSHVRDMRPPSVPKKLWTPAVRRLRALVKSKDRGRILEWFEEYCPECIALVPIRRRPSFVDGVLSRSKWEKVWAAAK
jgi:hypothetical protein